LTLAASSILTGGSITERRWPARLAWWRWRRFGRRWRSEQWHGDWRQPRNLHDRRADLRCVAAVGTACGGSSYTPKDTDTATTACPAATDATRAPAAAGAATISIDNFSYGEPLTVSPAQLSASPITPRPRIPSRRRPLASSMCTSKAMGKQRSRHPTQPGEYAFYCTYHPSMKGTLMVQ
jgi:hypothetical protein